MERVTKRVNNLKLGGELVGGISSSGGEPGGTSSPGGGLVGGTSPEGGLVDVIGKMTNQLKYIARSFG